MDGVFLMENSYFSYRLCFVILKAMNIRPRSIKNDERGIGLLFEILLVVIVLGMIGAVGYKVINSKKDDKPTAETSETKLDPVWTYGGAAVEGEFADADIVQTSDKAWRLYYAIQPEVVGNNFEVYSATSSDGKTWVQEAGIRKTMATFPKVIKLADGRYRMYYQSAAVIKSAISTDGLSFTDEPGTRIDKTNSVGLTFDNVAAPTIVEDKDGRFVMVYRGTINERYAENTPNSTTQLLMWATSTDGLNFTKQGIAVDSRDSTLNGQLDGPDIVLWDDDDYRVFATTYTGVYEFTFDGTAFTNSKVAFAGDAKKTDMGFDGAPPGDPSVAKINGTWFMYYGTFGQTDGIAYATLK